MITNVPTKGDPVGSSAHGKGGRKKKPREGKQLSDLDQRKGWEKKKQGCGDFHLGTPGGEKKEGKETTLRFEKRRHSLFEGVVLGRRKKKEGVLYRKAHSGGGGKGKERKWVGVILITDWQGKKERENLVFGNLEGRGRKRGSEGVKKGGFKVRFGFSS